MIKRYLGYLKDNPKGYWFKARWFGWGWTPARWQGWVVVAVYFGFIVLPWAYFKDRLESEDARNLYLVFVIFATAVLMWICIKKGEKPYWNWWGPKKKK